MSLAHREPFARRPLALEILEDRIAPAGGVTTILSHGTLTITGDALANDIVIDQAGLAVGEFRIASGVDMTAVNGQAEDIIQGVTGIVLKLGDGNDHAAFDAVDVAKSLSFDGGTGTNTFDLAGGSAVGGSLWVTNGQSTNIADAAVTGSGKILNSAGSGAIVIDGLSARSLAITTGRGFGGNIIDLDNLSLTGALKILDRSSGLCRTDLAVADIASVRTVNGQGDFLLYADGLTCTSTGLSVSTHNNTWTSIDAGTISGSMSVRGGVFGGGVYLDDTTIAKGVNVVNSFQGLFVGGFSFTADNCDLGIDAVNHRNYSVRVAGRGP